MDFAWTDEQQDFVQSVRAFARKRLDQPPGEPREFSRERWEACAEFGIQGLPFPHEFGGLGMDALSTMLAMEALGLECGDQGLLFSIHAHMWSVAWPILSFGAAEQKQQCLPKLCSGEWVGAHAMSEPDSGSDAFSLRTRAEADGNDYVLNGSKTFVSNAPAADLFVCFATINPDRGHWGVTAFLIPRDTPGLHVSPPIAKMGLRGSPMGLITLEDCRVSAGQVLGKPGQGGVIFNHSMGWERSCILATSVGAMNRELDQCVQYSKERRQFGRSIGEFQLVAARLAEMKLRLETSRLLLYRTAWKHDRGQDIVMDAALAKLHISESAVLSALDAIQIHGGYGYMQEFEVEEHLRDAIGGRLYSGTSEMQRLMIARALGLTGAR